jgi:hypothetical protein
MLTGFLYVLFAAIGVGLLIGLKKIIQYIRSRQEEGDTSTREGTKEKTPFKLSDGTQIAITAIMIGVLLVSAFWGNFFNIFSKDTPSWIKIAVIFIIVRSVWFFVAPLGQTPTVAPIRNLTNILYTVALLFVIPAMIFGWNGKFDSLKFFGDHASGQATETEKTTQTTSRVDSLSITPGEWQDLQVYLNRPKTIVFWSDKPAKFATRFWDQGIGAYSEKNVTETKPRGNGIWFSLPITKAATVPGTKFQIGLLSGDSAVVKYWEM